MFEIREWVNEKKRTIKNGLTLDHAFKELKVLKKEEPEKVYSIYRSKEGRNKNDYCFKRA